MVGRTMDNLEAFDAQCRAPPPNPRRLFFREPLFVAASAGFSLRGCLFRSRALMMMVASLRS